MLGLLFLGLGATAAILSRSYAGASGVYPLALGTVLASIGIAIALRAMYAGNKQVRELVTAPGSLAFAIIASVGYLSLIVPLGFYTASVLLMLFLPLALGFRRLPYLLIVTAVFMLLVFIVFSVVLEKPLPAEFWSLRRRG